MARSPHPRSSEGPDPLAIITGASAGIGVSLARLAAADGYRPVLVARRRAKLEELAGELSAAGAQEPLVVPLDLSTVEAPERLMDALGPDAPVEMLLNNAGFGTWGPFAETALERTTTMLRVNITSLTAITRLLLPGMLARRRGYILNVASTAAFQPGPDMAVYYASKAYVLSFSEALSEELRGSGIRVSALCPGPTRTEFHDVAEMKDSRLMENLWWMDADRVAEIGYRALRSGRAVRVPGFINRTLTLAPRFIPRALTRRMVARIQSARRD
jgi:short-subunit dehydrogenase